MIRAVRVFRSTPSKLLSLQESQRFQMRLISVRFSDAGLERECETGAGLTEADIVRAEESLKIGSGAFVAYFA